MKRLCLVLDVEFLEYFAYMVLCVFGVAIASYSFAYAFQVSPSRGFVLCVGLMSLGISVIAPLAIVERRRLSLRDQPENRPGTVVVGECPRCGCMEWEWMGFDWSECEHARCLSCGHTTEVREPSS
jgi:hypothetical protein